jgi:hypothetical protein
MGFVIRSPTMRNRNAGQQTNPMLMFVVAGLVSWSILSAYPGTQAGSPSHSTEPHVLVSPPLTVQARSKRNVTPPQSRQLVQQPIAVWPGKAKRWALVIGVDSYRDPQISALKGSDNDARMLADALVRYAGVPQDQVILLATDQPKERQPTRVNILRRLSNLMSVVPKDGLLLFSFAGHGMERNGQAYLLPSDAQLSEDISFLEETAISVSRMKERIRATGVGQVVVLLDACRNDPGGRADAPNRLTAAYARAFNFDVRNREVQAFATLYATAVGQRAYEYTERKQGYFTWAIVEGLKGGAANEKGEVTLARLVRFVQEIVPKRIGIDLGSGREQKPFAVIEGYRAEDLVVAIGDAKPAQLTTTLTRTAEPSAAEMSFWEYIKNSNDPSDFQAYLEKFPNGTFAELARRRSQRGAATRTQATDSDTLLNEEPKDRLGEARPTLEKKIVVPGTSEGEDTGIDLRKGDRVTVSASGNVTAGPRVGVVSPDGRSGDGLGALTGYIRKLNGTLSRPFVIGSRLSFTCPDDGRLILAINDLQRNDNSGAFNVTIVCPDTSIVESQATLEKRIVVPGTSAGEDTGIDLRKGDRVTVSASGNVTAGKRAGVVSPDGRSGDSLGALIGYIRKLNGSLSGPFVIGSRLSFSCPADGRLILAIGDLNRSDNSGAFDVTILYPDTSNK